MADKFLTITFDVKAKVEQRIELIVSGITVQDLFEGIDDGTFILTLDHRGMKTIGSPVINKETGQVIARILEQTEIEGEYCDIKMSVDEDEDSLLGNVDNLIDMLEEIN